MGIIRLVRKLFGRDQWRPVVARADTQATLAINYMTFKDLIRSNDEVLEIIADLEERLLGESYFGMTYIRVRSVNAATHTYRMVSSLNKLSGRRYQELSFVFSKIQKDIESVIERGHAREIHPDRFVLRFDALDANLSDRAGGKSANLGEIRNRARLPVPEGFAVTTDAFYAFFQENQLADEIRALQINLDPENYDSLVEVSERIKERILSSEVPPALESAILSAYEETSAALGYSPRVSMRSSAVGEDGEISFAGQYVSVLNVSRDGLLDAYKEVVAGLYSPRAMFYRSIHGIPEEDIPMGVTCMSMVEATASGVAHSVNPNRPDSGTLVINGSWGLGVGTVDGSVSPDTWELSKGNDISVTDRRMGSKEQSVEPRQGGGVAAVAIPPAFGTVFCLSDPQVKELALLVMAAEKHYQVPQEVEWALDKSGRLFILQCRPLQMGGRGEDAAKEPAAAVEGHELLLRGASASKGCGCGPVFLLGKMEDLAFFPEGGILVARHSTPAFVKIMGRAAGIVTDIGATTGHMASLAREFGVPAVLDTRNATSTLKRGRVVTVDADHGAVYDGRVESLLNSASAAPARSIKGTPIFRILGEVAAKIVPLHLTDPNDQGFQPSSCRTLHDIARFVHEKSFEEMFRMSDNVADVGFHAVRLEEKLPFDVYMIDLGGGLALPGEARSATLENVRSDPMRALMAGMTDPELRWWEPRGISMRGFFSVATESLFTPDHQYGQRRLGEKSYAILADSYCNFSSRVGYHFTAVDAYSSSSMSRNHISFRFKGGAADGLRRSMRCTLIGKILNRLDFQIEHNMDLINARLRKFDQETIMDRLGWIGRLIIATRQLDMRMGPDTSVDWYVEAFFEGNYHFDPEFDRRRREAGNP